MSYGIAKRVAKNGNNFGKGEIEGVIAPETAAHAAGTAALLPMLSLGVPGSPTAAVLLGGLLIWGLQPGPMLFVEQKEFEIEKIKRHTARPTSRQAESVEGMSLGVDEIRQTLDRLVKKGML